MYDYVAEYRGMTVARLRCGTDCDMSCDAITVRNGMGCYASVRFCRDSTAAILLARDEGDVVSLR